MHRIALVLCCLTACARIYTFRAGVGVERASTGERSVQAALAFGFAGNVRGGNYVAPAARAGIAMHDDAEAVLGVGIDYLRAFDHATLRIGPDYLTRQTIEGRDVYHALGGRAAALWTFSNERTGEQAGILDVLAGGGPSNPMPALAGVGSQSTQGSSSRGGDVMRRHSIGIEGAAGYIVSGDARGVTYVGLVYEHDVLRAPK